MRTSIALASLFVLTACGPAVDPRVPTITALTGDAAKGATLFTSSCSSCHGADGKGTAAGKDISRMGARPAADLAHIVVAGSGTMAGLPALADQDIADVVAHVRASFK